VCRSRAAPGYPLTKGGESVQLSQLTNSDGCLGLNLRACMAEASDDLEQLLLKSPTQRQRKVVRSIVTSRTRSTLYYPYSSASSTSRS